MFQKILSIKETLLTSFWFIPSILVFLGIIFGITNIYIENIISIPENVVVLELFQGGDGKFSDSLSTISSSMISIAGLVFSMTLVALTLVGGQYGSRIIRNFMRSRLTQYVLGSYLATFIYSIIVLRAIKSERFIDLVPDISIIFVFIFTIINLILLIIFIHHISKIIQVENMIHDIFLELRKNTERILGDKIEDQTLDSDKENKNKFISKIKKLKHHREIYSETDGYITSIHDSALLKCACENDFYLQVCKKSGDYIIAGTKLFEIHSDTPLENAYGDTLLNSISFAAERTPIDDICFSMRQMVEVAIRALSPGINDPYTAIACLNNLGSSLSIIAQKNFPKELLIDENDTERVYKKVFDFDELVDLSFTQISHYGKENPFVVRRIEEIYDELLSINFIPERKKVIKKYQKQFQNTQS